MLKRSLLLLQSRKENYQHKLAFYLFLVSLGVFFLASMMAFAIIATASVKPTDLKLNIPFSFWLSTGSLLCTSAALHFAVENVHREQQEAFRRCLFIGLGCAIVFCIVQCFGMTHLINTHAMHGDGQAKLYGISFTLAFVHALHVLGGMIFLLVIVRRALEGEYDHEKHYPVDMCATYWHFLDGVWIVMLATFLIPKLF